MKNKKLYKSRSDKMLEGVCAGIAEYVGIDPTLVRLLWAFVAMSGVGIIAYVLCAAIMPVAPECTENETVNHSHKRG